MCASVLIGLMLVASAGQMPPGKSPEVARSAFDEHWAGLAGTDAVKAYRAIWELAKTPAATVNYVAKHLAPVAVPDQAKIEGLLAELTSDKFAVREKANVELDKWGRLIEPALRKTLEGNLSLETHRRLEGLLGKLGGPVTLPEELRQTRAVELLERLATAEARALLDRYGSGTPAARLTIEARDALGRLAKAPPAAKTAATAGVDLYGDPLPKGALGRLGTVRFRRESDDLQCLAFSPDGKSLTTVGDDGHLQIWDRATGQQTKSLRLGPVGDSFYTAGFALSPDGRQLAVGVVFAAIGNKRDAGEIRVYAIPSGDLIRTLERGDKGNSWAMSFSADGKILYSIGAYEGILRVEDIATGDVLALRKFPYDVQVGLTVSPGGESIYIAAGVNQRKLLHWNWRGKDEPREFPLKDYGLDQVGISPSGKHLAGVDNLSRLLVWELPSGRLLYHKEAPEFRTHYRRQPVFSPDGKTMALVISGNRGRGSGRVHLISQSTGETQGFLDGAGGGPIAFSADSRTLATRAGTGTRLFEVASRKEVMVRSESHDSSPDLLTATSNDFVATAGDEGTVRIWDAATMTLRRKWSTDSWVRALDLSADSRFVAASGLDDMVHVWNVADGKELYRLAGHGLMGGQRALRFTPDGTSLLSFGDDRYLRLWDMKTGKAKVEHPIRPDGLPIPDEGDADGVLRKDLFHFRSVFSADGKTLIVHSEPKVYAFDTSTGKQGSKFAPEGRFLGSMAGSPNSQFILSSLFGEHRGSPHVLSLVEQSSGASVLRFHLPGQRGRPVAYSPDGRTFATALADAEGGIVLYEKATGQVRGSVRGLRGEVGSLVFFPDCRRIASSHSDGTVMLWDLSASEPMPERKDK